MERSFRPAGSHYTVEALELLAHLMREKRPTSKTDFTNNVWPIYNDLGSDMGLIRRNLDPLWKKARDLRSAVLQPKKHSKRLVSLSQLKTSKTEARKRKRSNQTRKQDAQLQCVQRELDELKAKQLDFHREMELQRATVQQKLELKRAAFQRNMASAQQHLHNELERQRLRAKCKRQVRLELFEREQEAKLRQFQADAVSFVQECAPSVTHADIVEFKLKGNEMWHQRLFLTYEFPDVACGSSDLIPMGAKGQTAVPRFIWRQAVLGRFGGYCLVLDCPHFRASPRSGIPIASKCTDCGTVTHMTHIKRCGAPTCSSYMCTKCDSKDMSVRTLCSGCQANGMRNCSRCYRTFQAIAHELMCSDCTPQPIAL